MTHKTTFSATLILFLFATAIVLTACGGSEVESFTVGIANPSGGLVTVVDGFKTGMVENGYIEGENVTYIDDGVLGGDSAVWEAALQEMIDQEVDLILTMGTPMSIKAQEMTSEIPIVFAPITDPLSAGLVNSIREPGGNLTGIRVGGQDIPRLAWIKEVAPEIQTVYIAYNPNDPAPTSILPELRETAVELSIELIEVETPDEDAMAEAASNIPDNADAIYVMPDGMAIANIPTFRDSALTRQIPLASIPLFGADMGVLLTYGFDPFDVGQATARMADTILQGTDPTELPVETSDFFLTINLETASAIGLEVPDAVLREAADIIRPEQ